MNLIYQNGVIPTINKPTRFTKKTTTEMQHFCRTNIFVENTFKTAIIKSDVSDHFPMCIFIPSTNLFTRNDVIYQYKRIINDEKLKLSFKIFINMTGLPLKPIKMQMKLTIISY